MTKTKRTWDLITNEKRKECIDEIISFFKNERDEEIGIIAAEEILDLFLQMTAIDLYNKGIENSINFLKTKFEDIGLDMEALLKNN